MPSTPARGASVAAAATRYGVIVTTQGRAADTVATFSELYEQRRKQFGAPIGIRVFSNDTLPLPGDSGLAGAVLAWAARAHPDEIITVSHKTRDDARLRRFLDWVQANHLRTSIIYYHEPQNDAFGRRHDTRAQPGVYLSTYRAYRSIIDAHPARTRVTLEKNLMWFWQRYRAATAGGDWHRYVEAHDPADLLSWDTYVFPGMPVNQGRYGTADELFRYARDAWHQYHLAWAIGEIGTAVQDGTGEGVPGNWDPTGVLFLRWVKTITGAAARPQLIDDTYRDVPPARFMKWWDGTDAQNTDMSLRQVPAAEAYYRGLSRQADDD